MANPNDPMDPLRKAHEEEYFHKQNQQLVTELRSRREQEVRTSELASATQLDDQAVLTEMAEMGIEADQVPLLHLAPLIEVAWADGTIQASERAMLEEVAAEYGVVAGTPAYDAFQKMLAAPPEHSFFEAAGKFIGAVLATLPEAEAAESRANLEGLAKSVAKVTGGLLGIFNRIEPGERTALKRISERLEKERTAAVQRARDRHE